LLPFSASGGQLRKDFGSASASQCEVTDELDRPINVEMKHTLDLPILSALLVNIS
jgi:hypothetical protein